MKNNKNGFTVLEIIIVTAFFCFVGIIFFAQKQELRTVSSDNTKKISINAIYYGLEEVFYPANGYYPISVSSDNLKSVDPNLFNDPEGNAINTSGSAYSYQATDCKDNKCKGYTLKTSLEKEADYIKTSRN